MPHMLISYLKEDNVYQNKILSVIRHRQNPVVLRFY
jgi:hypothetical protein